VEIEAKFSVPDAAALERLETTPVLGEFTLDAGERRVDKDTFLDTADRRFLKAGYYLRRREATYGVRLTLKQASSGGGGVHRREELEALVAADVPPAEWPPGKLRERVIGIGGNQPLEPFLQLSQERMARRVSSGARDVAELSLDRVQLSGPDGQSWFEAELELRPEGTEEDLARLSAALHELAPLTPESRSKFARAVEAAELAAIGASRGAGLFPAGERCVHEDQARLSGACSRRAAALLALDDGLTQAAAAQRAGLSDRRVRYWLQRYRSEGVAIYGTDYAITVTTVEREPAPAPTAAGAADKASHDLATAPAPAATGAVEDAPAADNQTETPAEHARKRPSIDPSDSMTAAAVVTLRFHLEKMLDHEEGTRLGEDIEELHDMRVSTRRMRMALRVFADYLDADTMRPMLKGLRRTGAALGAVRDLDVFHEKTSRYLANLPAERADELDGLMAAWREERERQGERLVDYLDSERYRHFVEGAQELLDTPLEHLAPAGTGHRPQRVSQVLPGVLYQDMGAVWAFEGQIGGLETPLLTFHALRKSCKGLRYTLEFFEEVLGPGARQLIHTVKGMQDHLGDLQDAVVTCGVLRDFITWGEWRHSGHKLPEPTELIVAPGPARYLAARQEEMERLVLTFPEVWPSLAGTAFSRELAGVIAEL
jgi:CHAD domain-containing protein